MRSSCAVAATSRIGEAICLRMHAAIACAVVRSSVDANSSAMIVQGLPIKTAASSARASERRARWPTESAPAGVMSCCASARPQVERMRVACSMGSLKSVMVGRSVLVLIGLVRIGRCVSDVSWSTTSDFPEPLGPVMSASWPGPRCVSSVAAAVRAREVSCCVLSWSAPVAIGKPKRARTSVVVS